MIGVFAGAAPVWDQLRLRQLAASKQPIVEGMKVGVHWFKDSAQGDENRVVLLRKL